MTQECFLIFRDRLPGVNTTTAMTLNYHIVCNSSKSSLLIESV